LSLVDGLGSRPAGPARQLTGDEWNHLARARLFHDVPCIDLCTVTGRPNAMVVASGGFGENSALTFTMTGLKILDVLKITVIV
jgi:hypothetical protein